MGEGLSLPTTGGLFPPGRTPERVYQPLSREETRGTRPYTSLPALFPQELLSLPLSSCSTLT